MFGMRRGGKMDPITLSRLQFAVTALYHFIFVPLTIGLSVLLAAMETVYVLTKNEIWKKITKFWGILFGINFAMGVATGVPLEFQFGTNWAYYSQYIGDIFGPILAIEGLMAFFLEATLVGLFFFGWNKLKPITHLIVTWLLAIATNLSALWILVANGWMQNPVGAAFNPETYRMEIVSLWDVFLNPIAQAKFVHTVSAGYVTGAVFVTAISAFYLLRRRHREFAIRSMTMSVMFGVAVSFSAAILGDESGHELEHQPMKLAAIEAIWEKEHAPAPLTLLGLPDRENRKTHYKVEIPYLMGIMVTRSFNKEVPGVKELVEISKRRIESGMQAYSALKIIRENKNDLIAAQRFEDHKNDLGYALLLKKYRQDVHNANQDEIAKAADDTVPNVFWIFWAFRIMVVCGLWFIALFLVSAFFVLKRKIEQQRWLLWAMFLTLPLPWAASEFGWIVAEYGRQPWVIQDVLPTAVAASVLPAQSVLFSLIAFALFYSVLLIVDIGLMIKYVRIGPDDSSERH